MKKKFLRGAIVGIAAFFVTFVLHSLYLFRPLEWKSWDARLRLFADPARAGQDIVLILVDQYSLDVYGKQQGLSWPWPREMYAYLINYLQAGKAAACFIDIAMTEGSAIVGDDEKLAGAVAAAGNVFFPIALSTEEKESDENAVGFLRRFSIPGWPVSPPKAADRFRSVTVPLEVFLKTAKGVGNVRVNPDGDGIYRRMPPTFAFRDLVLPSVPLALSEFIGSGPDPSSVPLDETGQMIIRFWGPAGTSYRTYPIATLINSWAQMQEGQNPQIPPQEFAGKIVLVGLSAVGLHDIKSSPLSAVISGVEIQAAALDTLYHRNFIRPLPAIFSSAFVLLLALLTGLAVSSLGKIWAVTGAFVAFLAVPAAAACAAFAAKYWLEFVFPLTAVLLTLIGASVLNYSIEGRQRRFIKGVFSHYLSPAVIDRLIENPRLLQLGGEEREITSFFSDVAGFTPISEKLTPHELVALLNAYLSEMTDIILDEGGTLDKYEGDAIVAFWNAPLDDPNHALRACRAALACQKRLGEIEPDFQRRFGHGIRSRIGLNTGPGVVGNMGSSRRFDYTAMGDTVNLAARLESACKQYQVSILVGESTFERVKDKIVGREVDWVRVVGKKRPVRIFELIGDIGNVAPDEAENVRLFHQALDLFRSRRWDDAIERFRALAGDPLAGIYLERCLSFKKDPPPGDWDHVFGLKTK
jgi:adenylate cyclase